MNLVIRVLNRLAAYEDSVLMPEDTSSVRDGRNGGLGDEKDSSQSG